MWKIIVFIFVLLFLSPYFIQGNAVAEIVVEKDKEETLGVFDPIIRPFTQFFDSISQLRETEFLSKSKKISTEDISPANLYKKLNNWLNEKIGVGVEEIWNLITQLFKLIWTFITGFVKWLFQVVETFSK